MQQKTLTILLELLLLFGASSAKDDRTRPEAKLIHRFERSSGDYGLSEAVIDISMYAHELDGTAVVRVCSKEPLSVALLIAAANPFIVTERLSNKYPPERVLFLRSEDCLGSYPEVAATELWAIPKGAALPSSAESIKSGQVRLEPVGTKSPPTANGVHNYRVAVEELVAKLHARPKAVGVILGYYYKNPSVVIKQRLHKVQSILEQSELPRNRYFVRLAPWTGEYAIDPPDPEPRYPSLFIVEVSKSSKQQ